MLEWGFNMIRTLLEYHKLPFLDDKQRSEYHDDLMATFLNDKEKYHEDIKEMIDYFITELGNADFIRMVEKIKQERIM